MLLTVVGGKEYILKLNELPLLIMLSILMSILYLGLLCLKSLENYSMCFSITINHHSPLHLTSAHMQSALYAKPIPSERLIYSKCSVL